MFLMLEAASAVLHRCRATNALWRETRQREGRAGSPVSPAGGGSPAVQGTSGSGWPSCQGAWSPRLGAGVPAGAVTSSWKGSEVEGGDEVGGDEEAEGGHSLRLVVGSSRTQHSSSQGAGGLAGRGRLGLERQEGSVMTSSLVKRMWWR